jgi:hypothetical protein
VPDPVADFASDAYGTLPPLARGWETSIVHAIVLHADSDTLAANTVASMLLPETPATSLPAESAPRATFGAAVVGVGIITPATDAVGIAHLRTALSALSGRAILCCLRGAAAPAELTPLVAEAVAASEDRKTDADRLRRSIGMVAKTVRVRNAEPASAKRRGPSATMIAGVGGALAVVAMALAALSVPGGDRTPTAPVKAAAAAIGHEPTPMTVPTVDATAPPPARKTQTSAAPSTRPAPAPIETAPPVVQASAKQAPPIARAPSAAPADDDLRPTLPAPEAQAPPETSVETIEPEATPSDSME